MTKRIFSAFLCAAVLFAVLPKALVPSAVAAEREMYNFTFDNQAEQGEHFGLGASISAEWVNSAGVGHGDNTALKLTHTKDTSYKSSDNMVRLTLPEPLPAGGIYRIVAWVYAPSAENPGKGTLTGPGIVLNDDYAGAQGEVKFPPDFGTLPLDEWKQIDVTLPLQSSPINMLDFRIVINEADKHPDIWYWDNIEIYQVGETESVEVSEWNPTLVSLKETYKDHFLFGNILEPNQISNAQTEEMYKNYYNAVTAGNAMKPISISTEKDLYSFTGADVLVDWAKSNGMAVHGHTLVWHDQTAAWLNRNADGTSLTRTEAKENLAKYISTVAGHFKGEVLSWDVVNEAFMDSVTAYTGWRDCLRKDSPWYLAYANGADTAGGESPSDYLYDAFVFARIADPNAILYYLDFNEEEPNKCEAMAQMAEELNEQWKSDPRNTQPDRLLVEGMGMQAHYWTDLIKPSAVEATIKRFIKTGARISISELDIPFGTYGNFQQRTVPPTEDELANQAKLYGELFEIFTKYSNSIERVTVWGMADSMSWRGAGYPVLFDKLYAPKPAFWSVIEAAELKSGVEPSGEAAVGSPPADTNAASSTPAPTSAPVAPAETSGSSFPVWLGVVIGAVVLLAVVILIVFLITKNKSSKP